MRTLEQQDKKTGQKDKKKKVCLVICLVKRMLRSPYVYW